MSRLLEGDMIYLAIIIIAAVIVGHIATYFSNKELALTATLLAIIGLIVYLIEWLKPSMWGVE